MSTLPPAASKLPLTGSLTRTVPPATNTASPQRACADCGSVAPASTAQPPHTNAIAAAASAARQRDGVAIDGAVDRALLRRTRRCSHNRRDAVESHVGDSDWSAGVGQPPPARERVRTSALADAPR